MSGHPKLKSNGKKNIPTDDQQAAEKVPGPTFLSFLPRIKYGVNSSRNPVFPRGPGLPLSRERQEMEFFRGLIGFHITDLCHSMGSPELVYGDRSN